MSHRIIKRRIDLIFRINKRRLVLIFQPQDPQKEAGLASGVRQHTKKLEKTNKQNRFQKLHHPEDHQLVKFVKKNFVSIISTLQLYHGLLRNKHNKILLELALGVRQHTLKIEKPNKQNRFQELHHPKDHQLVKFFKNYFISTLRLYHGLLSNKHNKILLGLALGVRQHTLKLEKTNKQNRLQELHHPEDHQLLKDLLNKKNKV